jgi:hypothetical protein
MKAGDLVRYAPYPHKKLHESGRVGLVLDAEYSPPTVRLISSDIPCVLVLWDRARGPIIPVSSLKDVICWEYTEELEVVK